MSSYNSDNQNSFIGGSAAPAAASSEQTNNNNNNNNNNINQNNINQNNANSRASNANSSYSYFSATGGGGGGGGQPVYSGSTRRSNASVASSHYRLGGGGGAGEGSSATSSAANLYGDEPLIAGGQTRVGHTRFRIVGGSTRPARQGSRRPHQHQQQHGGYANPDPITSAVNSSAALGGGIGQMLAQDAIGNKYNNNNHHYTNSMPNSSANLNAPPSRRSMAAGGGGGGGGFSENNTNNNNNNTNSQQHMLSPQRHRNSGPPPPVTSGSYDNNNPNSPGAAPSPSAARSPADRALLLPHGAGAGGDNLLNLNSSSGADNTAPYYNNNDDSQQYFDENGNLVIPSAVPSTQNFNHAAAGSPHQLHGSSRPGTVASGGIAGLDALGGYYPPEEGDGCYEDDESDGEEDDNLYASTDDEQDFDDEAFKEVADDINVNVNALLKKLRQADTFDRRETMLKKGNVKNANIVQVELYDDEEEDDDASSDDDEDEDEDDDDDDVNNNNNSTNNHQNNTRGSSAKKLWDRLTSGRSQHSNTASNTRNNLRSESPYTSSGEENRNNNNNQNNNSAVNSNALLTADQQHLAASPSSKSIAGCSAGGSGVSNVSMATQPCDNNNNNNGNKLTAEHLNKHLAPTTTSPSKKNNNNREGHDAAAAGDFVDDDNAEAIEKERLAVQHATRTVEITQNSGENEDVLINEMAKAAKSRLTADKHSGSTVMTRASRRSSNRFDGRESEEMSVSSRATFRDDASAISFNEDGTRKPRSALKRSKKRTGSASGGGKKKAGFRGAAGGRGGVSFSQNEVSEVCIFEVGDELYVGVQFKRSWVGWVAALLAVIFETIYDVHVVFLYLTTPYPIGAVQAWVGTNRFIVSAILFLVAYFAGVGVQPLKHVMSGYGALVLSIMAITLSVGVSLEAVVVDVTSATHFFVASVMYCVWIVLYRLFIKEAVFMLEIVAILVTVAGFIISNMTYETSMSVKAAVTGNVVIFISSILYAAYFFLLFRVRKWAPIVPMATFQGIYAVIFALPLAAILKASAGDIFAFATNGTYFGHSLFISVEGVISNILLILTIDYLDILSVASIFILKSAAMPIFSKLIILDHFEVLPEKQAEVSNVELTWYLYLGYILAIVGCITTVVFASVRRSFVMRRIASSKRKKAPNPYTKKRRRLEREAAAMGITPEQHQQQLLAQQQMQQQQYQQYLAQQQQYQQHYHQQQQHGGGDDGGYGNANIDVNQDAMSNYYQQQQHHHQRQHHQRSASSGGARFDRHGRRMQ